MIVAFEILLAASVAAVGDSPDWYKVLQVEPFSHINTIKKQYKHLALVLHPDKNSFSGCEEAFKLVNEGFGVFSDRIKRKEYDTKLRIKIQDDRVSEFRADGADDDDDDDDDWTTFQTACPQCQLLHKFKRTYLGHNLICPNCRKSFEATEVEADNLDDDKDKDGSPLVNGNSKCANPVIKTYSRRKRGGGSDGGTGNGVQMSCGKPGRENLEENLCKSKENESEDETMTLARMQSKLKKKVKSKIGEKTESQEKDKVKSKVCEEDNVLRKSGDTEVNEQQEASKKRKKKDFAEVEDPKNFSNGAKKRKHSSKMNRLVDDLDLYDFEKDRTEKSFKKGKIWAIYDDTDGIPRRYGLIDEVVS